MSAARRRARRRGRRARGRRRPGLRLLKLAALVYLAILALTVLPLLALRNVPPPTSAFMLQSRLSADPATGRRCERVEQRWVPWASIGQPVKLAVLVAEDQRFAQHSGFDFDSIADALEERVREGRVRGASTLSQQVAKNLFLWPERSWLRKAFEAWFTVWIEVLWSKRRILETYLNVAQFGPCLFGVEAAGLRFFGLSAAELGDEQAALLAAVLPDPGRMRAGDPGPYLRERSAEIRELMARHPGLLAGL